MIAYFIEVVRGGSRNLRNGRGLKISDIDESYRRLFKTKPEEVWGHAPSDIR